MNSCLAFVVLCLECYEADGMETVQDFYIKLLFLRANFSLISIYMTTHADNVAMTCSIKMTWLSFSEQTCNQHWFVLHHHIHYTHTTTTTTIELNFYWTVHRVMSSARNLSMGHAFCIDHERYRSLVKFNYLDGVHRVTTNGATQTVYVKVIALQTKIGNRTNDGVRKERTEGIQLKSLNIESLSSNSKICSFHQNKAKREDISRTWQQRLFLEDLRSEFDEFLIIIWGRPTTQSQ